ncbi:MAG: MFS transporter, partial [Nocardioidaceae bacterium]
QIVHQRFNVGNIMSGVLSGIPWAFALVTLLVVSRSSERHGERRWHMVVCLTVGGAGIFVSTITSNPIVAIIGLCLGVGGLEACIPLFWNHPASRFSGTSLTVALALINSVANLSGFVGPYMFGGLVGLTGSNQVSLYVMAASFFLAAALVIPAARFARVPRVATPDTVIKGAPGESTKN